MGFGCAAAPTSVGLGDFLLVQQLLEGTQRETEAHSAPSAKGVVSLP